jgi:hypothetical protein
MMTEATPTALPRLNELRDFRQYYVCARAHVPYGYLSSVALSLSAHHQLKDQVLVPLPIETEEFSAFEGAPAERDIQLSNKAAECLMNDLWNLGVRPTAVRDRDEMLSIQRAHLDDMRQLVFETMKIAKPGD